MPERTEITSIVPGVLTTLMNASGQHGSFKYSLEACSKKKKQTHQPIKPNNYKQN